MSFCRRVFFRSLVYYGYWIKNKKLTDIGFLVFMDSETGCAFKGSGYFD